MERDLETAVARGHVMGSLFGDAQLEPQLGRYRLRRLLGRGAHGRVFEGYDPELDRVVAIKVAHEPDGTDDEARAMRNREARALAKLTHPNVVEVFDVGVADGLLYVVMALVEGEDLATLVARERPELPVLLDIFVSAGRGLAAAHAEGLRHGDFKPGNVLVGAEAVKVVDFGLAHLVAAPTHDAEVGDTLRYAGTPLYMAPEQLRGESSGPPADQYAFCVALWEMLCGTPPFQGAIPIALLEAKEHGPSRLADAVPRAMAATIRRGLAPDPADRFPSMNALLRALERSQRSSPRPLRLAAVGAAVVVGGVLAAALPSPQRCDVASAWDHARRLELSEQMTRFTPSEARSALVDDVHAYGERWRSARDTVCEARTREAAIECLDSAALELVATIEALGGIETDADLERYARPAVRQLPDPARCKALRRSSSPTTDRRVAQGIARTRALQRLGQPVEALEAARGTLSLAMERDLDAQAQAHWELGRALNVVGRADESREHLAEAFYAGKSVERPRVTLWTATMLADSYLSAKDVEQANEWIRHAEAVLEGVDDPNARVAVLQSRANLLIQQETMEEARAVLDEAMALSDGRGYEASPLFFTRARVHQVLGDLAAAEADFRRSLELDAELLGREHPELIGGHAMLATVLIELGRHEDAWTEMEAAVALGRKWLPAQSPGMARLHEGLGMVAQAQGKVELAEAEHQRALEIRRAILPDAHPAIAASQYNLGLAAAATGRHEEAVALHRDALRRLETPDGEPQSDVAEITTALARALIDGDADASEVEATVAKARRLNGAFPKRGAAQAELDAALERWRRDPA